MPAETTTHVDPQLLSKAMTALMKHHANNTSDKALLGDEKTLQVQFSLNRVPESSSAKPISISIPHALYKLDEDAKGVEEPEVCIIVKEDSKVWVQEMIQEFPKHLGFVKKVLGLNSLRKKHASYEQQRALLARYDVFMADDRILPMLAKCLGRNFFQAKKQPIPIRVSRKQAFPYTVQQALKTTHLFISEGTCITIRAGNTAMPLNQLIENVASIIEAAPLKMPRKWANVRSISIKTSDSMALPVYNKVPEEIAEIAKLAGVEVECDSEILAIEEARAKKDIAAKKKRKAKSPLVQALKQLEGEVESKRGDNRPSKKTKTTSTQETEMSATKQTETIKAETTGIDASQVTKSMESKKRRNEPSEEAVKETLKATETKKKRMETVAKAPTVDIKLSKATESKNKHEEVDDESVKEAPKVIVTKKLGKASSEKVASQESKETSEAKNKKGKDPSMKVVELSAKSVEAVIPVRSKNTQHKMEEKTQVPIAKISKKVDDKLVKTDDASKPVKSKKTKKEIDEKKETKTKEAKNATKKADDTKAFISSSKFTGSKLGYVFQKGSQGVGYYIDVKPVVDKMAMQALTRMGKSSPSGGGGSGKKGKRSRR